MQQQTTTSVQASCDEIITEPSKAYTPIYIPQSKNVATLSGTNFKKIKYLLKELKQNKEELKNIEAKQHQMTTNAKTTGAETIDKSSEVDYMRRPIFNQRHENFATLSDWNDRDRKIKYPREKLEQNENKKKNKMKKKNKTKNKNRKKLKNIEATQQQATSNIKVSRSEIMTKPSKTDYIRVPVYIPQSENFVTSSEGLKQSKEELKNTEVTQQQATNGKTASVEITQVPNKIDDEKSEVIKQNPYLQFIMQCIKHNVPDEKFDIETNKTDTIKDDLKLEGEKQRFNLENQQYTIGKMKQEMIENNASRLENTSEVSEVVKDSGKNNILLPSVMWQRATMKEKDYDHLTPANIAEESNKAVESLKHDKESNKDSLIKLFTDFDEIKNVLNTIIIKITKLTEITEDLKSK